MMELSNMGLKIAMQNIKNLKENMNAMSKKIKLRHNKPLQLKSMQLKILFIYFDFAYV